MRLGVVLSGAVAVVVGAAVAGAVVLAAEGSGDALPSDAYDGRTVCPGVGPLAPRARDGWNYTASLSRAAGLVVRDVRFGPRLLAHTMSVPYIRIHTGKGWHRGLLTPSPRSGDDVKVSLVGQPRCVADDGAPGASAIYVAEVGDLKVLVQQSYRFDDALDTACEPAGSVVCHRFWPTTTWALVRPQRTRDKDVVVSIVQRFEFDPDDGRARGTGGASNLVKDTPKDLGQAVADHAPGRAPITNCRTG